MNTTKEKRYDLKVAVGLFLIIFIIASGMKCLAVMLTEIAGLGFSMAFIGIGSSVCGVCGMLSSVVMGKLVKVMKIKKIILLASVLSAVGYIILASTHSNFFMLLAFVMMGLAMTFGGYAPAAILLARWFNKKYALVVSIVFAAMSIGSATMSMAYGLVQPIIGFQNTVYILAGLQLVIPALALKFLIFENPSDVGVEQFAHEKDTVEKVKEKKVIKVLDITPSSAMKTPLCIFIFAISVLIAGGVAVVQTFIPMQAEILGFSKAQSSSLFSIIMITGAISTIAGGIYSDRKSPFIFYAFITFAFLLGWVLLVSVEYNYLLLVVIAGLLGIAYPSMSSATSLILKDNFGDEAYSGILGILHALNLAGMAILSPLAGFTYDVKGSYESAFLWLGGLVLIAFVSMIFYTKLRKHAYKKYADKAIEL